MSGQRCNRRIDCSSLMGGAPWRPRQLVLWWSVTGHGSTATTSTADVKTPRELFLSTEPKLKRILDKDHKILREARGLAELQKASTQTKIDGNGVLIDGL